MAYKFQVGSARLSGSTVFEEAVTVASLDASAGGVSNAGAIAGATTIDATGDLTVGSITMSEFSVDASGNTDVDGTLNVEGVPTFQAAAVFSGGVSTAGAIAGATTVSGSGLFSMSAIDNDGVLDNAGALNVAGLSSLDGGVDVNGALTISTAGAIAGATSISGSGLLSATTFDLDGAADIGGKLTVVGVSDLDGGINVDDNFTVSAAGAVVAVGVAAGGAVTGVTTLAASGLMSVASISMDDGSTIGPDSVADLITLSSDGDLTFKDGTHDLDIASHDGTNGLKLGGAIVTSTAAELNFVDVTAGTAAASKAMVLDADKDISGGRDLTIDRDFKALRHISASAQISGFSLDIENGANLGGTIQLSGITADTALDVANDGLFFNDALDGTVKNVNVGSFLTDVAGAGLTVISNQLAVQSNAVSEVVSGSTLSEGYNFIDATATGSAGLDLAASPSVGDVVHLKAGAGVSNTNFVEVKVGNLGSHKIDTTESAIRIESPFGAVSLVYVKANHWRIV